MKEIALKNRFFGFFSIFKSNNALHFHQNFFCSSIFLLGFVEGVVPKIHLTLYRWIAKDIL